VVVCLSCIGQMRQRGQGRRGGRRIARKTRRSCHNHDTSEDRSGTGPTPKAPTAPLRLPVFVSDISLPAFPFSSSHLFSPTSPTTHSILPRKHAISTTHRCTPWESSGGGGGLFTPTPKSWSTRDNKVLKAAESPLFSSLRRRDRVRGNRQGAISTNKIG
jgi:hypothetical protein